MSDEVAIVDGDLIDAETGAVIVTRAQLEAVTIEDLALDEEMRRAGRDLAYWNSRQAEAMNAMLIEKHEYERAQARAQLRIKAGVELNKYLEYDGNKINKPTVDDIKAAVTLDEEAHEAFGRYAAAEQERRRIWGICVAIEAKKDMTQSLAAKERVLIQADGTHRNYHRQAHEHSDD